MKTLPEIKKILYCTQAGPNAAYIFRHAAALARAFNARITVLHVIEKLTRAQEAMVDGYIGPSSIHEMLEQHRKAAEEQVARHMQVICDGIPGGPSCKEFVEQIIVATGHPHEEILRHIGVCNADVVVMGAHAESTILESLMGGTAHKVIPRSPVPVLVVQVPEGEQELTVT